MIIKNIDQRFLAYAGIALALLIFSILVFNLSKAIFFVALFIALECIIGLFNIPSIDIELISLGTILCTLSFGVKAGLLVAILGSLISDIINGKISYLTMPMMFAYCLIALITPLFSGLGIVLGGIIVVLIVNVLLFMVYYAMNYDFLSNVMSSASNIIWNLILFLKVAPFLFSIMK